MECVPQILNTVNNTIQTNTYDVFKHDTSIWVSFLELERSPTLISMDDDNITPQHLQVELPSPQSLLIAFLIVLSVLCVGLAYVVFLLWAQDQKMAAWMRSRGYPWVSRSLDSMFTLVDNELLAANRELSARREEVARLETALGGKPAREVTCCIMLDQHMECECILCPEGHAISRPALQHYVAMEVKKPITTHQKREGCIKCPVPECNAVLPERGMALHCNRETYDTYVELKRKVASQNAFEKALEDHPELSESIAEEKRAREVMKESIRQQFRCGDDCYYAFKCPQCFFGPIDKQHCDDLVAHHGEHVSDGVKIDNSCPMCGFYGTNITDWGKWDGEFLEGKRFKLVTDAIEGCKAAFEEKTAKQRARMDELVEANKGILADTSRLMLNRRIASTPIVEAADAQIPEETESPSDINRQINEGGDIAVLGPRLTKALRLQNRSISSSATQELFKLRLELKIAKNNLKQDTISALKKVRDLYPDDVLEYAEGEDDEDW